MLHQDNEEGQHEDLSLNQAQKDTAGMAHDGLDPMCSLLVGGQTGCQGRRGLDVCLT